MVIVGFMHQNLILLLFNQKPIIDGTEKGDIVAQCDIYNKHRQPTNQLFTALSTVMVLSR